MLWYLTRPLDRPGDQPASIPPAVSVTRSAPPGVAAQGPAVRPAEPNATTPQPLATPSPVPPPTAAHAPSTVAQAPNTVAELVGPRPGPTPAIREPELVALRGGTFVMGSNEDPTEQPVHQVSIAPLMMGKYPVTVREWNACASAKACALAATGADDAPVSNVSWKDARQYVGWLAAVTGKRYRLPTEAEWEYAARAGTQTRFWWGERMQSGKAACKDCGQSTLDAPIAVGAFGQNGFGLYDMGGTIGQWVEDCWHKNYQGAPADGSAWTSAECTAHVVRSGSWKNNASYARPSNRDSYDANVRYPTHGLRVALSP